MTREASAKYYKKTKKRFKRLVKDIKILLRRKTPKQENMVLNPIKISQKMKNKSQLSILKDIKTC